MVIQFETSVENCFVPYTHMLKASENREVRKLYNMHITASITDFASSLRLNKVNYGEDL